jgi:uncharacterized protein YuzE
MEENYLESLLRMVPHLTGKENMWVKYDKELDILYLDVKNSDRVTNAVLTDDDLIVRYTGREIAGITVLGASTRTPPITSIHTKYRP